MISSFLYIIKLFSQTLLQVFGSNWTNSRVTNTAVTTYSDNIYSWEARTGQPFCIQFEFTELYRRRR